MGPEVGYTRKCKRKCHLAHTELRPWFNKSVIWPTLNCGPGSTSPDPSPDPNPEVKERPFPSVIAVVSGPGSRPDGVIWSMQTQTVMLIGLTRPWEENPTKKHFEKVEKYNKVAIDLREGKHHGVKCTVVPLCVEVEARGAINGQPWNWMCKQLGFSK